MHICIYIYIYIYIYTHTHTNTHCRDALIGVLRDPDALLRLYRTPPRQDREHAAIGSAGGHGARTRQQDEDTAPSSPPPPPPLYLNYPGMYDDVTWYV